MGMESSKFLSEADRAWLRRYINRRKAHGLSVRRANALLALDKGRSFETVCDVLELGDSTLRGWLSAYHEQGLKFLEMKDYSAREGHLTAAQEAGLTEFLRTNPMCDTNEIRAHIRSKYTQDYSRSGCIKLLYRLGFSYKKPERLPTQADEESQKNFIQNYETLLNELPADEVVYFGDAVHPDHQVRPAYGWFHRDDKPAVRANSGRGRVNIHGAVCLENFDCPFVEAEKINADTTIGLFEKLAAANKNKRVIHLVLDNAKYHHAAKVREWLERPGCRIKIIWLPPYCPHLNPIERLWGVMHKHVTHNKYYKTYKEFADAVLLFLRETIPKNWKNFTDKVTDNFRVISTQDRKIIA